MKIAKLLLVMLFSIAVAACGGGGGTGSGGGGVTVVTVAAGNLATARSNHTATRLPDGEVLVAGGTYWVPDANGSSGTSYSISSAELYNPSTNTWRPTGSMTVAREGHTATLLPNGKVLVAEGRGPELSSELYDPSTGTWTAVGSMVSWSWTLANTALTATLLLNGKVLVAGLGSDAALYDPSTNTWTTAASSMITTSTEHKAIQAATRLPNGKVLLVGVYFLPTTSSAFQTYLAGAELYDPSTNTWTTAVNLSSGYDAGGTATLLHNGKVLVAGRLNSELYDPVTNTWTAISVGGVGYGSTATLLPNGNVMMTFSNTIALYDPTTNTMNVAGSMTTDRSFATATLLTNGKVLIAGGETFVKSFASAELY